MDLKSYLNERRVRIDQGLALFMGELDPKSRVTAAMRHSLFAGGKRLRPILCMAGASCVGADPDLPEVTAVACSLEMIHTFSLIHDDLPALDNDDFRRGVPTCHKAFDEPTAILAGDALLNLAFEVLLDVSALSSEQAAARVRAAAEIAKASGIRGMIEGQMRDILGEKTALSLPELEAMHRLKTGALITASVVSGALAVGADKAAVAALCEYGDCIGLAFQVSDDILNVEGDPAVMGKATGTDAARNKSTYPALLGLGPAKDMGRELVKKALQALDGFDNKKEPLCAIAGYVMERKK
ncbi:MAG: polyprenyl synthetase family protein [Thermodesulfobacteriota bacterium]